MSKKHINRKLLDELYMQDKKANYIKFLSSLIASNINAWYTRYHNKDDLSFEIVAKEAQEAFRLSNEDNNIIYNNVINILKENYHLKITNLEKLTVEKILKN